jgi:predicted enzyme related to lactoylglutathione lyase
MAHNVTHFAVHADDLDRAKTFYERVFGWRITPWGPPDFFMIQTGPDDDPGIHGSLQGRSGPAQAGGLRAFECTIGVDDVDAIATAVTEHGGKIRVPKMHIVGVGWLVQFEDPEGNIVSAMRYEASETGA